MPASHDKNLRGTRLQARQEVIEIPLPCRLAGALAVGVLAATHRVINNTEVSAPASNRAANTDGEILTPLFGLPLADRLPIDGDTDAEDVPVRLGGDEVADAPAESVSQVLSVARRDDRTLRMAPEKPCREDNARVCAFRATWRHEDHQPPTVAGLNRFELADQQPMMSGRDKAELAVANVALQARLRLLPRQQLREQRVRGPH